MGQTASLLPNAKQQFFSNTGVPLAAGTVDFFVPSTNTRKTTWFSSTESTGTQNTNPVILDAAGRAVIYGDGVYRQVLKDNLGNTIWDAITTSPGSGGGGGGGTFNEGVMVGTILPWANTSIPASYLYTAGQAVSRTTYALLLTALTYRATIICSSGVNTIVVSTTISDSIPIGAPIEASCFAPGTTVSSKSSGLLTMSTGATGSVSVAAVLFPWGNGDGSTTFNVPDLRGRVLAGRDNMNSSVAGRLTTAVYGSNPDAVNAAGGSQSYTLVTSNLPAYTPSGTVNITDPGHTHGTNAATTASGTGNLANGAVVTGPASINSSTTGISATFSGNAQGGSSTPFSRVQPTLTSDYIIKALPDDLPSGPGVTSIQGMTGVLFCGDGLICTAQTISAGASSAITVGTTQVLNGTTTNILNNTAGVLGEYGVATTAQMQAGTANKIVSTDVVWPAETTTTYNANTTFDFSTFRDTKVTLTGNITTQTLINVIVGKSGSITFIQDGTGSRTTTWSSIFKFAGGTTPTLTATAAAVDILSYSCRTSTFCFAAMMNDVK